ncbi:hypothetical protein F441_17525 [Phytophthora nicotianae CJ01A1]|uniref:Tc1-like transposase DDE domain-containing protein n=4 Tax=Phytophthora nicotianae TaxID=4792 RepID=W2QZ56_PHYN3|nr:hypothetical protein PPTG_04079 [Phytophthora nicotianae INRA-310]ETI36170.1 hypothetical protein F443_17658 [Phytophthora nicotianae P1569]ETN18487.1 hypothetical protein PPTG_04079 [Phytophthora nicotianae INRA-310]ETP05994.1 hypothetical protein F441_17525 [Phytophthora nicotianae CJ01A1]ETP34104.1 hypothetical protein F442_17510 [Phytophthora nicotianae P10297]
MFLAAVARPRWDPHRKKEWDGKVGLWPLTEKYKALRRSKYRTRGEECIRNIDSINQEDYKSYLLDHVIPAIKLKRPRREKQNVILIQQDNATPHISPSDPDDLAAGTADGWNIRLSYQPANSPDTNTLDLGLFASLQALQLQQPVYGIQPA